MMHAIADNGNLFLPSIRRWYSVEMPTWHQTRSTSYMPIFLVFFFVLQHTDVRLMQDFCLSVRRRYCVEMVKKLTVVPYVLRDFLNRMAVDG